MPKSTRITKAEEEPGSPAEMAREVRQTYSPRSGYRIVPAGQFKPACLNLMDQVRDTGVEIVITKRNRPVAKLVPVTDEDLRPFIGRSAGVIHASREELLAPTGEDWEVDADL